MKRLLNNTGSQWLVILFSVIFCGYEFVSGIASADTLSVTPAGSGHGTVISTPAGIACESGITANCSASFANMSGITLRATPDWKSNFGGWSGPCSGAGDCVFNIDGDTGVTATFDPDYQAALIIMVPDVEPKFASLDDAYAYANNNGKDAFSLNAHVYTFVEDLILNHQINFTLAGGMDSGYYTKVTDGFTTLQGYLEVQQGSVEIDSLIIQ